MCATVFHFAGIFVGYCNRTSQIQLLSTFFKRHSIPVLFLALVLTALFYPALFEGRSLLPTDMFDTQAVPHAWNPLAQV